MSEAISTAAATIGADIQAEAAKVETVTKADLAAFKAEIAALIADGKTVESKVETQVAAAYAKAKAFVLAHYAKVVAAVGGFAAAHYGVIAAAVVIAKKVL